MLYLYFTSITFSKSRQGGKGGETSCVNPDRVRGYKYFFNPDRVGGKIKLEHKRNTHLELVGLVDKALK